MSSPPAGPVAIFGGVYSNHLALAETLADARAAGAGAIYCLGDLGAFGPHPDRSCELLREAGVPVVQGNYDHSLGNDLDDCRCGYTDPRDNHFAALSYRYTYARTSPDHRAWMRTLPESLVIDIDGEQVLLCHGSPRRTNEFLWESTSSDGFLAWLLDRAGADALCVSHTGLPWARVLPDGRRVVNVGAIGRPANDGDPRVVYALLHPRGAGQRGGDGLGVEWRRVAYDHERLAREMEAEGLPEEFVETIGTGWWTTCLEVLPAKERARGRY
ncbi:MAG TPA: metallophosphoesterase family protein [Gemmatimonadota bacterium]|nr:metallophosphoesterase family protein [Gemmatimonadota bacterium]